MRLYRVVFDSVPEFVEAQSLGEAVRIWLTNLIAENEPGDFDDGQEPDSVELVHGSPVLRNSDG
jgi:hypothetical protein